MFNCPQWGISLHSVSFGYRRVSHLPNITSCDSLVRVCVTVPQDITSPDLFFIPYTGSTWTHLAELTFYRDSSPCPEDTILQEEIATTNRQDTASSSESDDTTIYPLEIIAGEDNNQGTEAMGRADPTNSPVNTDISGSDTTDASILHLTSKLFNYKA